MGAALSYREAMPEWLARRVAVATTSDADADEVARARDGDEVAFEALVSRHEAATYRVCRRLLADADEALDATQEAFLRAYRGLARFRGAASFRTWLIGIAINVCRNRLASPTRRAQRRALPLDADPATEAVARPLPDPAPGPEARAYGSELRRALLAALAALSAEHREVLVLREIEGLDYAQLAGALGVAEGTVKSRLARARAALRAALQGVWP
jgi:RNA polymerase sigma factor (sigma-70 family)